MRREQCNKYYERGEERRHMEMGNYMDGNMSYTYTQEYRRGKSEPMRRILTKITVEMGSSPRKRIGPLPWEDGIEGRQHGFSPLSNSIAFPLPLSINEHLSMFIFHLRTSLISTRRVHTYLYDSNVKRKPCLHVQNIRSRTSNSNLLQSTILRLFHLWKI